MNKRFKIKALILTFLIWNMAFGLIFAAKTIRYGKFSLNGKPAKLAIADIVVDGQPLTDKNAGTFPVVINSRTLVPIRFFSEKLGYLVDWDNAAGKVTITDTYKTIEMFIGKDKVIIDGISKKMTDSTPPVIVNSRTLVPIRFVVEQMGMKIDYDAALNRVSLNTETSANEEPSIFKTNENSNAAEPKNDDKNISQAKPNEMPKETDKTDKTKDEIDPKIYASKDKLSYEVAKTGMEDLLKIHSDGKDIAYSSFFMTKPDKLVIDIKSAVLNKEYVSAREFTDTFFKKIESAYHPENDTTRIVLYLKDNAKQDSINLAKSGAELTVKKVNRVSDNISKKFERLNGELVIKLKSPHSLKNEGDDLDIKLPVDGQELLTGTISGENNFVYGLEVTKDDQNYHIKGRLKDRTKLNITELSPDTFKISFAKQTADPPKIMIDPGHGGSDPGAVNEKLNIDEKQLNLSVAQKLYEELGNKGYNVAMTRYDDSFVELDDIAKKANEFNADVFISIHHNSGDNPATKGIETYFYQSGDSKAFLDYIHKNLISESKAIDRGKKEAAFVVIKKTYMPAVLLELGFITNEGEVKKNNSPAYQDILVKGISKGVDEYFKQKGKI